MLTHVNIMGGHEMSIDIWGPKIWSILHITSFSYADEPTFHERSTMYNFYHSLKYILPCPKCQVHFKESLATHMNSTDCSALESRKTLSTYVLHLHNEVNEMNGKEVWTYERAEEHYCAFSTNICSATGPTAPLPPSTLQGLPAPTLPSYASRDTYIQLAVVLLVVFTILWLYIKVHKIKQKCTSKHTQNTNSNKRLPNGLGIPKLHSQSSQNSRSR